MAKIIVFNNDTDRMESYYRGEAEPMPYNTNSTLKVREFRGSSRSNILWTTKRTMQSWNSQRYIFGAPITVGFAFKRPYEGGHGNQSQHYAGTAFDVGQRLSSSERTRLWNSANNSGVWYYVEPLSLTPTWVHFDKRFGTPACSTGGYPTIRRGSVSNYVLIAQDDLNTLGYRTGGLDRNIWFSNSNCCNQLSKSKRPFSRWNCWLQYLEISTRRCCRYRCYQHNY